jgi:hypothetical protein
MAKTVKRNDSKISEMGKQGVLPKDKFEEIVRSRAHELYVNRGRKQGDELGDWLKAEKMVMREFKII